MTKELQLLYMLPSIVIIFYTRIYPIVTLLRLSCGLTDEQHWSLIIDNDYRPLRPGNVRKRKEFELQLVKIMTIRKQAGSSARKQSNVTH